MGLTRLGTGWDPLLDAAFTRLKHEGHGGADATGIDPEGTKIEQTIPALRAYLDALVRWNERTDLTAARSAEELVDLTVADAFILSRASPPAARWIDVGSGAGAPAIPFALLTEANVTLVEPRSKRVAFLRSAIGMLHLDSVRVERRRSEQLPAAAWDAAMSRATLGAAEWLSEGARLARRTVWVLVARGESPSLTHWTCTSDVRYQWPLTGRDRRALCYTAGGART